MDNVETRTPAEGGPAGGPVYDGFISYSHAADDLLAPRLQAGLQRFAKPWWKRRALRIFRDETSLSASPHLWSSITAALDASDWFVLLLSPKAASSDWVNQEVEYWLEHKEASRILPVLTDGEFRWQDGDFVSDAAPPALHGAFFEDPRWVDLRFARTDVQLDLQNPRFSAAVADIASAIRGVPKDDLESEEVLQHRRTTRTAWGAAMLLVVFAVVAALAAGVAVNRSIEAQNQRDEATRQAEVALTRELIAHAEANLEVDPERSVLLALQAAEFGRSSGGEALPEVEQALARSVEAMRTTETVPGTTMAASLSGDVVATVGEAGTVRLWEGGIDGAGAVLPIAAELHPAFDFGPVGMSGDGKFVAYASPSTTPLVFDTASGGAIAVLEGHTDPVAFIGLNSNGTRAVSGGGLDFTTTLWSVVDGSVIRSTTADSNDGVFSRDGRLVAYGDISVEDGSIFIWEADNGSDVTALCCHEGNVLAVAFGPDATILASTGFVDGRLRLWDVASGEELWSRTDPSGQFSAVAFSADGALIATGSRGGTVRLWDATTGNEVMVLGGHRAPVTSLAFDNGNGVLSASFDGETRLWNIGPNQPGVIEFTAHPVEDNPRDDALVTLRFNQTGDRLVTLNGYDAAKLWNLADVANPVELSSVKEFFAVAIFGDFSEDGAMVAIGAVDSDPRVFDAETGELLMTLEDVDTDLNRGVAFSPNGTRLVTGSGCCGRDPDGAPKIWDLATGSVLTRLEHRTDLWEVDWSPNGTAIATVGEDGAVRVWDPETGEERYAIPGGYIAVRFSPDGSLLATAGQDLKVWNSATGEEVLAFDGHAGLVVAVDFSSDGSQLVSGGSDTLAKIWDVATGLEIQTLTEHPRGVSGVAWSSDGTIVTVSDLGDVRLHIRDLDALERIALERVTRSLSEAECRQYLHVESCPTP